MANKKQMTKLLMADKEVRKDVKELENPKDVIRKKLYNLFKYHIGRENAITPYDVFVDVFNKDPYRYDVFVRSYYWGIIRRIILEMRVPGDVVIMNNGRTLYVLRSKEELGKFDKRVDNHIKSLKIQKVVAKEWVENKRWKKYQDS